MKALLGLFVLLGISHVQGQVVAYKHHLVHHETTPGFRSRTHQNGWMLVDLSTKQIASVSIDKRQRVFSVEYSKSSQVVEQNHKRFTVITTLEEGSLAGLTLKSVNKAFNLGNGDSMSVPKTFRVSGANGQVKFSGNLLLDQPSTRNIAGNSPTDVVQNLKNTLLGAGYVETN